jgi:hypothetical protein
VLDTLVTEQFRLQERVDAFDQRLLELGRAAQPTCEVPVHEHIRETATRS